jgi:festuclavine dehydrogenase
MKSFIDLALQHHVKRLVLLSASLMDVGDGPNFSEVSGYIAGLGVEWAVLRPTWFMENFSEQQYLPSIRDEDRILTATGDGRVPFVSAEDIADVAYRALVDEKSHDTDHLILGPELFSYDEVSSLPPLVDLGLTYQTQIAEIFTKALGRTITHIKITEDQVAAGMEQWGIPPDYARMLAGLDTAIKDGKENRLNDVVLKVTGHPPKKFEVYLGECTAREVWDKKL